MASRHIPPPTRYAPRTGAQTKSATAPSAARTIRHGPPPTQFGLHPVQAKPATAPSTAGTARHTPPPTRFGPQARTGAQARSVAALPVAGMTRHSPPPTRFGTATGGTITIQRMIGSSPTSSSSSQTTPYKTILQAISAVEKGEEASKLVRAAELIDAHAEDIAQSPDPRQAILDLTGMKPSTGFSNENPETIRLRARAVLELWKALPDDPSKASRFAALITSSDPCLAGRLNHATQEAVKLQNGWDDSAFEEATDFDQTLSATIMNAAFDNDALMSVFENQAATAHDRQSAWTSFLATLPDNTRNHAKFIASASQAWLGFSALYG